MSSRDKILAAVLDNQPPAQPLPDLAVFEGRNEDTVQKFIHVLTSVGGQAFEVNNLDAIRQLIRSHFGTEGRIVTSVPELNDMGELVPPAAADPRSYGDVELSVLSAHFGVAENGAVWITQQLMGHRILPFICQHLALIVPVNAILPTMHEAYARIGTEGYGFGTFLSGPSKTADIEQALILGAHGPKTMTVFLIDN